MRNPEFYSFMTSFRLCLNQAHIKKYTVVLLSNTRGKNIKVLWSSLPVYSFLTDTKNSYYVTGLKIHIMHVTGLFLRIVLE